MPKPPKLKQSKKIPASEHELGMVNIVVIVVLIVGIMIGVALLRNPVIFQPKAAENELSEVIDIGVKESTESGSMSVQTVVTEAAGSFGTSSIGGGTASRVCSTSATKTSNVTANNAIIYTYTYPAKTKVTKLNLPAKTGLKFIANGQYSESGQGLEIDYSNAASNTITFTVITDTACMPFNHAFTMTNNCGVVMNDYVGMGSASGYGSVCAAPSPTPAPTPNSNQVCQALGKIFNPLSALCEDMIGGASVPDSNNPSPTRQPQQAPTPSPAPTQPAAVTPTPTPTPEPTGNPDFFGLVYNPPPVPAVNNTPPQSAYGQPPISNSGGGNTTSNPAAGTQSNIMPSYEEVFSEQKITVGALNASTSRSFNPAALATDGNLETDWEAATKNKSYIDLDLKHEYNLTKLRLNVSQKSLGNKAAKSNHVICLSTEPAPHFCPIKFDGLTTDKKWLETDEVKNFGAMRYIRIWTNEHPEGAAWREIEVYGMASANNNRNAARVGETIPLSVLNPTPVPSSDTTATIDINNPFKDNPANAVAGGQGPATQISKQNPVVRIGKFFQDLIQVLVGK